MIPQPPPQQQEATHLSLHVQVQKVGQLEAAPHTSLVLLLARVADVMTGGQTDGQGGVVTAVADRTHTHTHDGVGQGGKTFESHPHPQKIGTIWSGAPTGQKCRVHKFGQAGGRTDRPMDRTEATRPTGQPTTAPAARPFDGTHGALVTRPSRIQLSWRLRPNPVCPLATNTHCLRSLSVCC